MAKRGATTFKKRQKEQERKERQQDKFAKRMDRKNGITAQPDSTSDEPSANEPEESNADDGQSVVG